MQVVIHMVTVQMKPEHRDAFIDWVLDYARISLDNELGQLRFDVLQDEMDHNRIHLYQCWLDQAALETHRQMPHYLQWPERLQDWFAKPVSIHHCTNIFPEDDSWM